MSTTTSHPSQIDKTTLIKNLLDFSRSRDQRPPGSLLHKRKEPGNKVGLKPCHTIAYRTSACQKISLIRWNTLPYARGTLDIGCITCIRFKTRSRQKHFFKHAQKFWCIFGQGFYDKYTLGTR
jgi:hypothetical protein